MANNHQSSDVYTKEFYEDVRDELDLKSDRLIRKQGEVGEFILTDMKRMKKDCKTGKKKPPKKEVKEYAASMRAYLLPPTIHWMVTEGFRTGEAHSDNEKIKKGIYARFTDDAGKKFLKEVVKMYKNTDPKGPDRDDVRFFNMLPIILSDILIEIKREEEKIKKEGEGSTEKFDSDYLFDAVTFFTKSLRKKLEDAGVSPDAAYDLASFVPSKEVFTVFGRGTANFFARRLVNLIYTLAKKKEKLPINSIMRLLVGRENYLVIIRFCLRERKRFLEDFTEDQKRIFNKLNEWIFEVLEEEDKDVIKEVIEAYVQDRKNDDKRGRDENRRYFLSSIPETEYKKIAKTVQKVIKKDPDAKKYL